MKDLDFIRTVVKEWPEGEETVRLDLDGEICFTGSGPIRDFYPENIEAAKLAFVPKEDGDHIGTRYTREQWEHPATDPVIEALKVGLTPEQLQALMASQDGLQLRADAIRSAAMDLSKTNTVIPRQDKFIETSKLIEYATRVKAGDV